MARVPIEAGYFRIPDDPDAPPVLLGSTCPNCGEVYFPRRMVCAQCLHEGTDDVELSTHGRLWTSRSGWSSSSTSRRCGRTPTVTRS